MSKMYKPKVPPLVKLGKLPDLEKKIVEGTDLINNMSAKLSSQAKLIEKQAANIERLRDMVGNLVSSGKDDEPKHLRIMDLLKEQLLIVLLRRLGGKLKVATSEIDDTAGASFAYGLSRDGKAFTFEVIEKEEI